MIGNILPLAVITTFDGLNDVTDLHHNTFATSAYSNKTALGPQVIKLFSCSTELSKNFFMLINVKMPTIVGIFTFISGKIAF